MIVFNGNTSDQILVGTTLMEPGSWNHAVYVRDGKGVRVYVNGEEKPQISLLAPVVVTQGTRYSGGQLAAFGRLLDLLAQRNSSLSKLRGNSTEDSRARLIDKASAITEQARATAKDSSASADERIASAALIA